jgi:hypothetical protein
MNHIRYQPAQAVGRAPVDHRRRGASTLDYILVLGIIMPLATVVVPTGIRILRSVYEMTCVLIAWPFM